MGLDNIIYEESPCTDTNVLTLTQDLVGGIMTGENAFRGKVFDSLLSEITNIDSVLYGNEDNYIERATLHALSIGIMNFLRDERIANIDDFTTDNTAEYFNAPPNREWWACEKVSRTELLDLARIFDICYEKNYKIYCWW